MKNIVIAEAIIFAFIHFVIRPIWNVCMAIWIMFLTRKWTIDICNWKIVYNDDSYFDLNENGNFFCGEPGSVAKRIDESIERLWIPGFKGIFEYFKGGKK